MEKKILPIVPGGKYEGKMITELIEDKWYVDNVLKKEENKKWGPIYNIIINQNISTNKDCETPEHNKLQNMFLDKDNQQKLLSIVFNGKFTKSNEYFSGLFNLVDDEDIIRCFGINIPNITNKLDDTSIIFEDKFNWDVVLYYNDNQTFEIISNLEIELFDKVKYKEQYDIEQNKDDEEYEQKFNEHYKIYRMRYYKSIIYKYIHDYSIEYEQNTDKNQYKITFNIRNIKSAVFCEIKPTLGEDYPCVLRKLKTQIELSAIYKPFLHLECRYILIIGSFTSKTTSKEQLIQIFKQSKIKIIFTDKIFESSNTLCEYTNTEQLLYENKINEKTKILTDNLLQIQEKLLQAEKKIKELEEENLSLKTQKQYKTIKTIKTKTIK